MKRFIYQDLIEWKNKVERKPLILNGARQVGKTYILTEFANREFEQMAYFSLDRNDKAREVFLSTSNTADILLALSALSGVDIKPGTTILVLDEIQECPRALTALKYFCEDMPELHIAVAGSLLGLSLHSQESFPVGKVEILTIFPMSFEEFLTATGNETMLKLIQERKTSVIETIREKYIDLLRQYFFVGGMPEVVKKYVESRELTAVRNIQNNILQNYKRGATHQYGMGFHPLAVGKREQEVCIWSSSWRLSRCRL